MRVLKTICLVIAVYIVAIILEIIVAGGSENYQGGISYIFILIIVAIACPKVGYRWFDSFFVLIPFFGIYFIFKIAHRVAFLPSRDWSI